ncbi:hypothetical protein D1872_81670 [compost metagenome]
MTKVATTLTDALRKSPEELSQLGLEELEALHTVLQTGATKAAKLKLDIVNKRISDLRKATKTPRGSAEPVVNSAKSASKTPAKPRTVSTSKKTVASKGKASAKPAKPAAKPKEETEQFKDEFEMNGLSYKKFVPESVEQLQEVIAEHPYNVYVLMDELFDDRKPTFFLVTYVSSKLALLVDMSRDKDSFISANSKNIAGMISKSSYTDTAKEGYTYSIAFYLAAPKSE